MWYSYNKLRGRIVELYGSQVEFSKKIGLTPVSISKKLNGKTEFSQSDIEHWAEALVIERVDFGEYFFT